MTTKSQQALSQVYILHYLFDSTLLKLFMTNNPSRFLSKNLWTDLVSRLKHRQYRTQHCRARIVSNQQTSLCHCPACRTEIASCNLNDTMRSSKSSYPEYAPRGRVNTDDIRPGDDSEGNLSVTSHFSTVAVCAGRTFSTQKLTHSSFELPHTVYIVTMHEIVDF
jgi:hypothetical protein